MISLNRCPCFPGTQAEDLQKKKVIMTNCMCKRRVFNFTVKSHIVTSHIYCRWGERSKYGTPSFLKLQYSCCWICYTHTHTKHSALGLGSNSEKWLNAESFCQCKIDFLCLFFHDNTQFDSWQIAFHILHKEWIGGDGVVTSISKHPWNKQDKKTENKAFNEFLTININLWFETEYIVS